MNRAFITGSHAYGTPTKDSDIDLVILTDEVTACILADFAGDVPVYFGDLNLIMQTDQKAFDLWKECNTALMLIKPVTKEFAIDFIEKKFKEAGLSRTIFNSGENITK